jgi:hypothetical protein
MLEGMVPSDKAAAAALMACHASAIAMPASAMLLSVAAMRASKAYSG